LIESNRLTLIKLRSHLLACLRVVQREGKTVGLIPTMGALHQGHLSLVKRSLSENDLTVCTIFINPAQFNDPRDLQRYPRTLGKDLGLLTREGCQLVFAPAEQEVYLDETDYSFELGESGEVMEAAHRPGHFKGVVNVVKRFFDLIQPSKAYFGQKDFQQCAIIKKMCLHYQIPVQLEFCPTKRESDGLAMSSRNILLSPEERAKAPLIFKALTEAARNSSSLDPAGIKAQLEKTISASPGFSLDYFEIVDADSLQPVNSWDDAQNIVACIAVQLGKVRLIDNMILRSSA
jgi:pantoate--beta-alanine ligase